MIGTLFVRELLTLPLFKPGPFLKKLPQVLLYVIGMAAVAAIECFIYVKVYDTFQTYQGVNRALTAILLFVLLLASVVYLLPKMARSFFSLKERLIVGALPLQPGSLYGAKALLFYFQATAFHLLTTFPISIAYCVKSNGLFAFYIVAILFALFFPLLSVGLASLLCPLFALLSSYIKRNIWVLLLVSFALMTGLAFLYSAILRLFVDLVVGNSLNYLLTKDFVAVLLRIGDSLYPFTSYLKMSYLGADVLNFLFSLLICFVVYVISYPVLSAIYSSFLKNGPRSRKKEKWAHGHGMTSPVRALIKKEFFVLSSSNEGVLSFFSLVLVSPFLIISVYQGVNAIFRTGNLNSVRILFSGFEFFISIALLFLFLSVVNGSGGFSLDKEGRCVELMKQFPIRPKTQLRVKIAVPYIWAGLAFIVSTFALACLGSLDWPSFALITLSGLLFLASLYFFAAVESLANRPNSPVLPIVSFVAPFVLAGGPALLTLIDSFGNLGLMGPNWVLLGLSTALFIVSAVAFEIRADRLFIRYEVRAQA